MSQLHARLAPLMRTLKPQLDYIQSVACGVKEPAAEQPAPHAMAITNRRLPRAPFETFGWLSESPCLPETCPMKLGDRAPPCLPTQSIDVASLPSHRRVLAKPRVKKPIRESEGRCSEALPAPNIHPLLSLPPSSMPDSSTQAHAPPYFGSVPLTAGCACREICNWP